MKNPYYSPLYTLKAFAENIWLVDGEIIKFYGLPFTTRMTIIRLENNDLIIHSPIVPKSELIEEINKLGTVKHIISPNKIHYWYIPEFKNIYPSALVWASPGVRERAKKYNKKIIFDQNLEIKPPDFWQNELDQTIIQGSRFLEEVIFFHKQSKTLIVTDIIENFEQEKLELLFTLLCKYGGALAPNGGTTIDQQLLFLGRKEILQKSIHKIFQWQPEKIILAHGKCFEKKGFQELQRIFQWTNN